MGRELESLCRCLMIWGGPMSTPAGGRASDKVEAFMSIIRALCLVLAGAMAVAAQEPNSAPQKPNEKPSDLCSVEGVVLKSTTAEGLKRVTVQLSPVGEGEEPYSTLTESNGRFVIHDIAPGRYAITVWGEGYTQVSEKGKGGIQSRALELTPGKTVSGMVFRMLPPGVITGTVYDEDGEPVISAQVRALHIGGSRTHRQIGGGGFGQTNDLGEYRIWGVQPGRYLVAAIYQTRQFNPGRQADEVYLPTYHPSTGDTSQAVVVDVQAGAETSGVDVELKESHAVTVRGRVTADIPMKSLRGIYVSLEPRGGEGNFSFSHYGGPVQNDLGDFEIRGVPPGPYDLSSSLMDGKRQLYGRVPVDVGYANLDGITFVLGSPAALTGRFRVEGDGQFDFTRLGLWLQGIDNTNAAGGGQVKADGTFVMENVYDGTYRLHVAGFPEEYYVKSARQGGSEVLESGLTVSHSQTTAPLDIVLSLDGGRVDGSVLQEQNPVGGAMVVLVPDPPRRDRQEMYSLKPSDALGRFSMLGLPPGDFKLFAWENVQGTNYTDSDFIKAFEDRGTHVHITQRDQQTVQLQVITAEEQLQ